MMTTEELKVVIRTVLDETGINQAQRSINKLGDSTRKALGRGGATAEASASFEELRDTIDQIRNLQFADMVAKQLDTIKSKLGEVKTHTHAAVIAMGNAFKGFAGFAKFRAEAAKTGLFYKKAFADTLGKHSWKQLEASIASAKDALKSFGEAGKAAIKALHLKVVALVGVFVGLGAAIKNAFSTANEVKALNQEASKIGMSLKSYQEWSYIMQKSGADAGVLGDAIKTLSAEQMEVRKGTEDSIERFSALGMSMQEVANMSQEQLFKETIRRLQQVRNEVDRTALAYQIFGEEDAAQLANVLRLTNAETASLAATNQALGASISQELLVKSQALSSAVSTMKLAWQGLTNTLAEFFMPVLTTIVNAITKALIVINTFLKTIFGIDMTPAMSNIGAAAGSANVALGETASNADAATGAIAKLKRATMGFDELNIVTAPTSGGAGAAGGGGGVDIGGGGGGFTETESALDKVKNKWTEFGAKVQAFMDKWKPQLQTIAGLLGALSIAGLITSLGKAIGLGDTFLKTMGLIKNLALSGIIITLQYTLVNEFMENYINGEGFKNYILGVLSAAVGTGLLYAIWGPAGAAIGLGVTAVASLKAIIDNGGITSTESAVVALTALASAMGAIGIAWKSLGLKTIVAGFGTFFTSLKTGQGVVAAFTTAFPKLGAAIAKIGPAFTTLGGTITKVLTGVGSFISTSLTTVGGLLTKAFASLSSGLGTVLAAVKTAISSAISFIIANPIALIIAAIVALVVLIATKGDEIKAALNKVSDWLKSVFCRDWREVFGNTLGTAMNGFVKIAGDVLGNVKKVLTGLIDFIRGVFTGDWKRAWNGIKDIFSGVFNGLKAIAKAPINAVITMINTLLSGVVSGLNAVKRALNNISISIPDWVPKYGGKKFGFNFSMSTAPQIPMLAAGGIITGDTVARLGERGKKEAVLPLEQNTGWMDSLADKLAARSGNSAPTKVVLKVGERELGYAVIDAINQNTRQTGGLKLQLV